MCPDGVEPHGSRHAGRVHAGAFAAHRPRRRSRGGHFGRPARGGRRRLPVLGGATAWTLESSTGGSPSSYGQTYTAGAQGPVVKVFMGMPGPQLSARLFAGVGQYQATYKEQSQMKGRVDDPNAVWYSETYAGHAPGYEVGFELRSGLGPQAVLTASVGYGWLRVRNTINHDRDPGPELDFSGLRLRGGIGLSF